MRMAEHSEVHAFIGHANPSLVRYAEASGGSHAIGDVCDPRAVAAFARAQEIDLAMVSADEPLAAGVVDALLAQGTRAVGPTRDGAEIEWNKVFARSLLAEVAPEAAPMLRVVAQRARGAGGDRVLRLDAGGGEALGADRRQGREGDGPASGRATRRRGTTRAACSPAAGPGSRC